MSLSAEILSQQIVRSQRLASRFAAAQCVADVAQGAIAEVREVLGAASAAFYEVTDDPHVFRLVASFGIPDETAARLRELPLATPLPLFEAIRTGRAGWYSSRAELVIRYPHLAVTGTPPAVFEATICIPLLVGDKAIGGLAIGFSKTRTVNEADAQLIVELGAHAALALERCRTQPAPAESARAQRTVARVEREVARSVAAVAMARGVVGTFEQVKGAGDMLDAARNASLAAGIICDVSHALSTLLDGTHPEAAAPVVSIALDALAVASQQCAETALGLTSAITEIADEGESNKPAVPDH